MDWRLRTFAPGDMGWIASRQAELYAREYGWGRPLEILLLDVCAGFLRDHRPGRDQCWVAERANGERLGAIFCVDAGGGLAKLRLLHVEAEARGRGVGAALVAQCVGFARAAGYARIELWTHAVLTGARKLYAAQGFAVTRAFTHTDFGVEVASEMWELDL